MIASRSILIAIQSNSNNMFAAVICLAIGWKEAYIMAFVFAPTFASKRLLS